MIVAVESECIQQTKLDYMINSKQMNKETAKIPLKDIKSQIEKVDFQILEEKQNLQFKNKILTQLRNEKHKLEQDQKHQNKLNDLFKERNEKILLEQLIFQGIIEKEREIETKKKAQILKEKKEKRKILEDLQKKDQQLLEYEIKMNNEYIKRQEQLFSKIQEVTNINNITEMMPHLVYLQQAQEHLETSKQEFNEKIQNTKQSLEETQNELEQIRFFRNKKDHNNFSKQDYDQLIQEKAKNNEKKEQKYSFQQDLLASIVQSVNRLFIMINKTPLKKDQQTNQKQDKNQNAQKSELTPNNVDNYLAQIGLKIERMA